MNRLAIYASLLVPAVALVTTGWISHEPAIPPGFGASGSEQQDWSAYGGAPENNHYSTLAQINRSNVKRLAVAWSFDTQEDGGPPGEPDHRRGRTLRTHSHAERFSLWMPRRASSCGNSTRGYEEHSPIAGSRTGPMARTNEFSWV